MKTYVMFAVSSLMLAALLATVSCESEGGVIRPSKNTRATANRRIARKNKNVKAKQPVKAAEKPAAATKEADPMPEPVAE